jgi:hypothetical protein
LLFVQWIPKHMAYFSIATINKLQQTQWLNLFVFIFFLYCAVWEYIVAFTKVLTMYQLYHVWIHPFHCSQSSPYPHSWNSYNRYHYCIYMHVVHLFLHCIHPPTPFPCHLSPSPPGAGPVPSSCSLILQKGKEKRWKGKHDIFVCLR